jgi:hypothetical protein
MSTGFKGLDIDRFRTVIHHRETVNETVKQKKGRTLCGRGES